MKRSQPENDPGVMQLLEAGCRCVYFSLDVVALVRVNGILAVGDRVSSSRLSYLCMPLLTPGRRKYHPRQVKIVDSKKLFSEPEKTAADVAKFAGLSEHTFFEFGVDR